MFFLGGGRFGCLLWIYCFQALVRALAMYGCVSISGCRRVKKTSIDFI